MQGATPRSEDYPSEGEIQQRKPSEVHPEWVNSLPVRRAMGQAGCPDCEAIDVLERLHVILDCLDAAKDEAEAVLQEHGLSMGEFVDLVAGVRAAEASAEVPLVGDEERNTIRTPEGQDAVRQLFLRSFTPQQIADIIEVPVAQVEGFITGRNMVEFGPDVIRLHYDGMTPKEIHEELGVSRKTVYKILEDAELTPNRKRAKPLNQLYAEQAIILYRRGVGPRAIGEQLGVGEQQVKWALRRAHDKGLLPEYGHMEHRPKVSS